MMAFRTKDKTRAKLRREICDIVNDIGSVDNCNTAATIDKPETCTSPPELTQRLRKALAVWFSPCAAGGLVTNSLVYDFGDYKSGQALALDALSPGGETTQFHCIRSVAEEFSCEVFLIKLKRKDNGNADYEISCHDMSEDEDASEDEDEENGSMHIHAIQNHGSTYAIDDRTWTAEVLVDWKSGFKLDGYPLEADAIVQDDFDMEAYDDEEYLDEDVWDKGPYQAPQYFNRWFSSTAYLLDFLCELTLNDSRSSSVSQLVSYAAAKCRDPEQGHDHVHGLFELCTKLSASPNQLRALDEDTIIKALQLAVDHDHAQLFGLISNNIAITLSPERFFTWAGTHLRNTRIPLGGLLTAVRRSLSTTSHCSVWYKDIIRLRTWEAGAPHELQKLAQDALSEAALFCRHGDVFEQDGEALVHVACRFKSFDWLLNEIEPIVQGRAVDFAFAAAFCWTLYNAAIQGELPRGESLKLLKSLVAKIHDSFDITQLVAYSVYSHRRPHAEAHGMPLPPPPVSGHALINQLRLMMAVSSDDEVRSFLSRITEQVRLVECRNFTGLYLPVLNDLMGLAQLHSEDLRDSPHAGLAREIILEYWQQQNLGVGPVMQAQAFGQMSMMLLNCGCRSCQGLHHFFVETPNLPQAVFGSVIADRAELMHLSTTIKQCSGFCGYEIKHDGLYCKWLLTKKGFLPMEQHTIRMESARATLGKANQLQLALVLGEPLYRNIMGTSPPSPAPYSEVSLHETSSLNNILSHGLP
ncbi:hypothetical protein PG990_005861 [Apiospora arundinis]